MTQEHAGPSSGTDGEPYKVIIMNELDCSDALVEAISKCLPRAHGKDRFYDEMADYSPISAMYDETLGPDDPDTDVPY